jgi:hypothetical protein
VPSKLSSANRSKSGRGRCQYTDRYNIVPVRIEQELGNLHFHIDGERIELQHQPSLPVDPSWVTWFMVVSYLNGGVRT